jgi:hypothetical protein
MTSPSAERKATKIADDFLAEEFDDDDVTKAWLVERISDALEEAEEAGLQKGHAKAVLSGVGIGSSLRDFPNSFWLNTHVVKKVVGQPDILHGGRASFGT